MGDEARNARPPPQVLGGLGAFNPARDNISSYLERVQLFFEANTIEDDRPRGRRLAHVDWREDVRHVAEPAGTDTSP